MASTGMSPLPTKTGLHMLQQTTWFEKKICVPPERAVYIPCSPDGAGDLGSAAAASIPCISLHTQLFASIGSNNGVNPWIGPSHALVHEWWVARPLVCTQELPDSSLRSSPPTIRYTTSISQKDPREQSSPRRHAGAALPKEAGIFVRGGGGGGWMDGSM
jgi:hypothetical protein